MFTSWLLTLLLSTASNAESPFAIDFTCSDQVFDISSLSCTACDATAELVASSDKSTCLPCDADSNAVYNASTLQCQCPADNEYLVDLEDEIACNPCPTDHAVSLSTGNRYECLLCESPKFIDSANKFQCRCPADTHVSTLSGDGCVTLENATYISNIYDLTASTAISYPTATIAHSELFEHYFLDSAVRCKLYSDMTSCQILANLCALTLFNKQHNSCQLFIEISDGTDAVSHSFPNWKQTLPFLFYPNHHETTSSALSSALSVSLNTELTLIVVKYAMNGTMMGYQEITDELLHFCKDRVATDDALKFKRIGHNVVIQCKHDLSWIFEEEIDSLRWDEPIFYDPYLFVPAQNTYYPVPVVVRNMDNHDGLQMVRRFFLWDHVSSNNELVTFLKSATFKVAVFDDTKIRPPQIQIEYGLKKYTDSSHEVSISFDSHYAMDLGGFNTSIVVMFVIVLILVLLLCGLRVFRFHRMESNEAVTGNAASSQQLDLLWFIRILFLGLGVSANWLFWLSFLVSAYCYLSFKGQSTIKFLMPEDDDAAISAFKALLVYCFFAKVE